jgi:hypothetical protein
MAAMRIRGPKTGLVYTWHAVIDRQGRIISKAHMPQDEGQVLARMCLGNLLGTGSSALMRKHAVLEAGCYDASLRERNAQGCEDYKLYFKIAERYEFAVIKEHLTSYRVMPGNMSSDVRQMLRSHDLVTLPFREVYPEYAPQFHESRNRLLPWLFKIALMNWDLWSMVVMVGRMFENDHRFALKSFSKSLPKLFSKSLVAWIRRS